MDFFLHGEIACSQTAERSNRHHHHQRNAEFLFSHVVPLPAPFEPADSMSSGAQLFSPDGKYKLDPSPETICPRGYRTETVGPSRPTKSLKWCLCNREDIRIRPPLLKRVLQTQSPK